MDSEMLSACRDNNSLGDDGLRTKGDKSPFTRVSLKNRNRDSINSPGETDREIISMLRVWQLDVLGRNFDPPVVLTPGVACQYRSSGKAF